MNAQLLRMLSWAHSDMAAHASALHYVVEMLFPREKRECSLPELDDLPAPLDDLPPLEDCTKEQTSSESEGEVND